MPEIILGKAKIICSKRYEDQVYLRKKQDKLHIEACTFGSFHSDHQSINQIFSQPFSIFTNNVNAFDFHEHPFYVN